MKNTRQPDGEKLRTKRRMPEIWRKFGIQIMFTMENIHIIYYKSTKPTIVSFNDSGALPSLHQSPFPPAGRTEISAALVQPFPLISRKAVKRKNRALTGANDYLERRVVPNVRERAGNDVGRPVDSIRAGFKAVIFDGAIGVSVLSRQIGESGNPMRTAHVNRDEMRQRQIVIPTGVPEGGRVAVNRVGCGVVSPGGFLAVHG